MSQLDIIYRRALEQDIIEDIAAFKGINYRHAADIYYRSQLSRQISQGLYGIQYLSHQVLSKDLMENEPELFQ